MYYIFYISNILRIYLFIQYYYGIYVSYCFLKHTLDLFYSSFIYIYSMLKKPNEQLEDKYIYMEIEKIW